MSINSRFHSILLAILILVNFQPLHGQDKLSWLDDYTGEMLIGTDAYQYKFFNVDGNDCKLKFEELVTDKKGSTESHSWIFYLADLDPLAISFKAKGKSIAVTMETYQSQKFITYYEDGELKGFSEKIVITLNEVDMARSFIETIKTKISNCKESEVTWENQDQAITWLVNNVGKATQGETNWGQQFQRGSESYLINFQTNSVNEKGEQASFGYIFDLSDINPSAINLRISGKSLMVEVPVKEGKRFIQVKTSAVTEFTNELLIYANEIELARQIIHALTYVVTHATPEREQWDSYATSLGYVKDHLEEVKIADEQFSNGIGYEDSPSGLVSFTIGNSDSDGTSEIVEYSFYLADLMDKLGLEVSKSSITIKMETKNKQEFIHVTRDGKLTDYASSVSFHVSDIDLARDLINAFEQAIRYSEEKIAEFSTISEVSTWCSENIGLIEIDGNRYEQNLSINMENENQLIIEKKLTEADKGSSETRFILYPEDISMDELDIQVTGKKLSVPLETGKGKYIKKFENGVLQNFTGIAEILFNDPLVAKNFISSIRFLNTKSMVVERATINRDEAIAFLSQNIQNIDLPEKKHQQKLEVREEGNCKMSFTRMETDDKGGSEEYIYEFIISDIHPGNSKLSVKGEIIELNLVTNGNEKLIKPYKKGQAGDFVDDFVIYVDDILLAKKTLAAFKVLSEGCK